MTVSDALVGVTRLGFDSAPFIYYIEHNPAFYSRCFSLFTAIDAGRLTGFTSTITLVETLIHPLMNQDVVRADAFRNLILKTAGIQATPLTVAISEKAADLRVRYGLRTPDAIQVATALGSKCDAFVTNDFGLRRITEIRVIVLAELTQ